jgi:cyanamide hydratase
MLHDMGAAPKFHLTTPMSFELKGGLVVYNFILSCGDHEVADRVTEACINYTIINQGKISQMDKLIQFSVHLDVLGVCSGLYHPQNISKIIEKWLIEDFHSHFADFLELKMKHEPGC